MLTILQCTNTTSVISKWGTSSPFSSLGDIQKVRSLKIPEFWTPLPLILLRFRPCSPLFFFEHPSSKVRSFWLELPLSPSISIPVKFREKKLIMSKWSLYKVATIGAWQKCSLYRESIQNSEVFKSKHEIYYLSWLSKSRFIWRTKIRKD